ncbi:sel1 repeat family protein [Pseudovibrio sp. JE062]|uniref:sel1 repeat family protein n=1 Tax=Pseudovibrio sp. JE062 TaxID=439495 RepID=UPI000186BCDB|nr:sel1 repeat family protein [Pseudovibrio sp. JE062]EEA94395.1 Sel1 repeat family protein [Pseudovibrio sp. JE062]
MSKLSRFGIAILFVVIAVPIFIATPYGARHVNTLAARSVTNGNYTVPFYVFRYLSVFNNLDALNNLGVLHIRGLGVKRNRQTAQYYFTKAEARGHVVARFNLAKTLPSRSKTLEHILRAKIHLLLANVSLGDIPSHLLLADTLYFVRVEKILANHKQKKLEVLKVAAETDDPDYLRQYAEELEVQGFVLEDAAMIANAIKMYKQAYQRGSIVAAERLGSVRNIRDWDYPVSRADLLEYPKAEWTRIAAKKGRIAAVCKAGLTGFGPMRKLISQMKPSAFLNSSDNQMASFLEATDAGVLRESLIFFD